jgi:hypothetical protein
MSSFRARWAATGLGLELVGDRHMEVAFEPGGRVEFRERVGLVVDDRAAGFLGHGPHQGVAVVELQVELRFDALTRRRDVENAGRG